MPVKTHHHNFALHMGLVAFAFCWISACDNTAPGAALDAPMADPPVPRTVKASEALASPALPTLDPSSLNAAEIAKVLPGDSRCEFSYTSSGKPIVAAAMGQSGAARGVIKIHGLLVEIASPSVTDYNTLKQQGGTFAAGKLQFEIAPKEKGDGRRQAIAHFRVGNQLHVGYGGYYECHQGPT